MDLPSLLPPCPPCSPLCPPCSFPTMCARVSIPLMLSSGKARTWVLGGGLKELQSLDKPGNVLAGSVGSSPPLLPPACVSSVTVAGRLQCEGAFPSQLQCWAQASGTISLWNGRTGVTAGWPCMEHLLWSGKFPGRAGIPCLWNPIPCVVLRHTEM